MKTGLTKKRIVDKNGKRTTVWVSNKGATKKDTERLRGLRRLLDVARDAKKNRAKIIALHKKEKRKSGMVNSRMELKHGFAYVYGDTIKTPSIMLPSGENIEDMEFWSRTIWNDKFMEEVGETKKKRPSEIKKGNDFSREKSVMDKLGLEGFNKPKATPSHDSKSHVVMAKEGNQTKLIRFGEQGASTAGAPKEGETDKMKKKRASFKARHAKNISRGKMSAAYWADKVKW